MTPEKLQECKQYIEKIHQCTLTDEQVVEPILHRWIASYTSSRIAPEIRVAIVAHQDMLMLMSREETIKVFNWMHNAK